MVTTQNKNKKGKDNNGQYINWLTGIDKAEIYFFLSNITSGIITNAFDYNSRFPDSNVVVLVFSSF